jgi:hypothetical protein
MTSSAGTDPDRLSDETRARLEQGAERYGSADPPIPKFSMSEECVSAEVRARIERYTDECGRLETTL